VYTILHAVVCHCHVHVGQIKSPWRSGSLDVIAHWKVAITIGITTRWGNMRRVDNIAVNQSQLHQVSKNLESIDVNTYILLQFLEPLRMTLLNMFLPEVLALE
jgi:hypothetical protein